MKGFLIAIVSYTIVIIFLGTILPSRTIDVITHFSSSLGIVNQTPQGLPTLNLPVQLSPIAKLMESTITFISQEDMLLDMINQERIKVQLDELEWSDRLNKLAKQHSERMARTGTFEHSEYNVWENIFQGFNYASERQEAFAAMLSWMNSPTHKNTLLQIVPKKAGIGIIHVNNIVYITFLADIY